jgi:predicted phosphodiesterase
MAMQRRKFIQSMMTVIGTVAISDSLFANKTFKAVRFGLLTDPHYADRAPANNRYYSESLAKVSECISLMNEEDVDFLVELGDLKDQGTEPNESETLRYLTTIEQEMKRFSGPLFHVLGNHDHDSISKMQFLNSISNDGFSEATNFYSFDKGSFHFIVLDANYTSDSKPYDHGNFDWTDVHVPGKQLKWLRKDLQRNPRPTIIFVHHQLDSIAFPPAHRVHCPDNADAVRTILEKSGNVLAVFQGHYHNGSINKINDIYYYTLKAVVEGSGAENNNYAIVEIGEDKVMRVRGFRKTESQELV